MIRKKPVWDIELPNFKDVYFAITYGLLSKSKELNKDREFVCEETREEMLQRMQCEVKKCCCKGNKSFFESHECCKCQKCKEC